MKILIIRFSSFGDVLQCLSVAGALHHQWPEAEIHWVTREEFEPLIQRHPAVRKVWTIRHSQSFWDLTGLGLRLSAQNFTHVYDAHNNLRSHVLSWFLQGLMGWRRWTGRMRFLRRSIYRTRRFLLFRFRINLFPKPFSGQAALLEPLRKWNVSTQAPSVPQLFLPQELKAALRGRLPWIEKDKFICLAPSAAYPLKRWPVEYWKELIRLLPQTHFVLLGGPEDRFLTEIAMEFPERVQNLAGRLSLSESAAVVESAQALISNDTGLMHVAEQVGIPCVALMGPAPFGFPSRPLTTILEVLLSCRPCSKHGQGPCTNREFQKCLRDIQPAQVKAALLGGLQ